MIRMLRGRLEQLGWNQVVLDVGGVGYRLFVPLSTREALGRATGPEDGATVRLHVYTRVREDAIELYGFATSEELEAFELLLGVNGVGARTALSMLSAMSPDRLYDAIAAGDLQTLQRIPGVGPRTAERLYVELRQKVPPGQGTARAGVSGGALPRDGTGHPAAADAVAALMALGFTRQESRRAVGAAVRLVGTGEPVEALVRAALGKVMEGA